MRCTDPGHSYILETYDGAADQRLVFMKREGDGYPFNVGHNPGTNCQEVLRALIDRVKYLQKQIWCQENEEIIGSLRAALVSFETRAAHRHGRTFPVLRKDIEHVATCPKCGHIYCVGHTIKTAE